MLKTLSIACCSHAGGFNFTRLDDIFPLFLRGADVVKIKKVTTRYLEYLNLDLQFDNFVLMNVVS